MRSWLRVCGVLFAVGWGANQFSSLLLAGSGELASLTAIFYALTYVGFAAPIVIAELEQLMAPAPVLLAGDGLSLLVPGSVSSANVRARPAVPDTV